MSISIMASGWRYSSSFRDLGNSKGLSTTHVVNKNSEKEFYKEIVKCIKELEGIFTIWKLICELNGRNFLYIHFSAANFTYQFEFDSFGPNAIKIVKLISQFWFQCNQNHNTAWSIESYCWSCIIYKRYFNITGFGSN